MLPRLDVLKIVLEVHLAYRAVLVGGDRLLYVGFDNVAMTEIFLFLEVSKSNLFDLGGVVLAVLHLSVGCDEIEVLVGIGVDFEDLESRPEIVKYLFLMLLYRVGGFGLGQDIDLRDDKEAWFGVAGAGVGLLLVVSTLEAEESLIVKLREADPVDFSRLQEILHLYDPPVWLLKRYYLCSFDSEGVRLEALLLALVAVEVGDTLPRVGSQPAVSICLLALGREHWLKQSLHC